MKLKKESFWLRLLLATQLVVATEDEDFGEYVKIGLKWRITF